MSKSKGNVIDPMDIIEGYEKVHKWYFSNPLLIPFYLKTVESKKGNSITTEYPALGSDALRMALISRDFKRKK